MKSAWLNLTALEATRALASTPTLFGEDRQPASSYIGIPKTSSERRQFIPIDFLDQNTIAGTELFALAEPSFFVFGILCSTMHMAWVRAVCGRLKSDYRYSASIVYNNFPWPTPGEAQRGKIEAAAQSVLAARALYPNATLADLYDPLTMPPELSRAHKVLDRAVDAAYSKVSFATEAERVAFLFRLYQRLAG